MKPRMFSRVLWLLRHMHCYKEHECKYGDENRPEISENDRLRDEVKRLRGREEKLERRIDEWITKHNSERFDALRSRRELEEAIREVQRLRELCGRAAAHIDNDRRLDKLVADLEAAAKGEK